MAKGPIFTQRNPNVYNEKLRNILTSKLKISQKYLKRNNSNLSNHAEKENLKLGSYYTYLNKNIGIYGHSELDNRAKGTLLT